MEYVVDTQGFQRDEFVLKELAVTPLNADVQPLIFLFKPPIPWYDLPARYKSINSWLERNYHHLDWSTGEVPYCEVENVLRSVLHNASAIYVKGQQKQQWLERFGFDARDVVACPSLRRANKVAAFCPYHDSPNCALRNVLLLRKFLRESLPSVGRSLKLFHQVGSLSAMEPIDIAQLPKEFIVTFAAHSVDLAWDKLPEFLKNDPEVGECQRCREHADKILPLKRECKQCILNS